MILRTCILGRRRIEALNVLGRVVGGNLLRFNSCRFAMRSDVRDYNHDLESLQKLRRKVALRRLVDVRSLYFHPLLVIACPLIGGSVATF